MKRELTVLVLDVDPIQSDGVEVGIESQIRAHALHGGNSATLASAETTAELVSLGNDPEWSAPNNGLKQARISLRSTGAA